MTRRLVNLTGWVVGGVLIGAAFVAAYQVSPWIPVLSITLITGAFIALTLGGRS